MSKIYDTQFIWGDLHLGDRGMWKRTYSKHFNTEEEYFGTLIKNHNIYASRDDTVSLFLGDIGQSPKFEIFKQMRGYKILMLGNHDNYPIEVYQRYFDEVIKFPIFIRNRIAISHIPIPTEPGVINVHGHIHELDLKSDRHINICPEKTDWKPVRLKDILNRLSHLKKPSYRFLKEWYKNIQVSPHRDDLIIRDDGTIDVEQSVIKIEEIKTKTKTKGGVGNALEHTRAT